MVRPQRITPNRELSVKIASYHYTDLKLKSKLKSVGVSLLFVGINYALGLYYIYFHTYLSSNKAIAGKSQYFRTQAIRVPKA